MLVDANLLLYATDLTSPHHAAADRWLTQQLRGSRRVGLAWQSLTAFLRISTNPRATTTPLSPEDAWSRVEDWLDLDITWVPAPTDRHGDVLGALVRTYQVSGNLVSDAHLASLAIEHGLTLCSADTDFARFDELRWENPLSTRR